MRPESMTSEARLTIRNVGLLLAQRGFHIVAGLLFAMLVPRAMGPETYGRYALITSIALWFALVSGMGAVPVMSRFAPQFVLRGDTAGLRKLVGNLLVFRITNGLLAGTLYLLLTAYWLGEIDLLVLVFVAVSVFVRTGANLLFALFLGLNQAARWGMGEFFRRWLSLVFLLIGFRLFGLRGACFGLVLTEVVVLTIGLRWARPYLSRSELWPDRRFLAPFLRYSALFFASNLLLALYQRSGETLVRLVSGDYAQVGYYALAYGVYMIAAHALWQFTVAFAPLFTLLLQRGETDALRKWVDLLIKWMAVGGVVVVFGALLLGDDLVPLVLGAPFRPVAANLVPLTLALLTLALGSLGRVMALTYDRPRVAITAAVIQLATFWGIGPPLVAWGGSLAGCVAVLVASVLYAAYYARWMRSALRFSPRGWGLPILLGALFLFLVWLRSSWVVNAALYGGFLLAYGGLLLWLRVVTRSEFETLRQALRPGRLARAAKP